MPETTMKAAFLRKAGDVSVGEMRKPEPGPHDALVRMKACGVCGSDIHYYRDGRTGPFVVREPLVLGHECSGEVEEIGSEVKNLAPGDRVAIEPGIPCRHCKHCFSGRYNLCRDLFFMATPPDHGAFCEYVAWPADFCYKLPDNVSCEVGATVEPLAVGLHGVRQVQLTAGESVVVLGAGPIGLVTAGAAAAYGAGRITAVDMIDARLDFARRMGATDVINAEKTDITDLLEDSADVVLDCVGSRRTVGQSTVLARPGGRICWIGMADERVEVPQVEAQAKELSFSTVWRYANVFQQGVDLLAGGKLNTEPMITHRFEFPDVASALKFTAENPDKTLKVMVVYP